MQLSTLLAQPTPNDCVVTQVMDDTRHLQPGDVFVFDVRNHPQGEDIVRQALTHKPLAVVSNVELEGVIFHPAPGEVLARWAKAQHPQQPACLVGVTGTNGKTSTAWFYHYLMHAVTGNKAASIGTLGVYVDQEKALETGYTSPTALQLHPLLENLAQQQVHSACLEVASIALTLNRLDAVAFKAVALTNITQDHLDFHGSMEAYAAAKYRLFTELLPADGVAVLPMQRPEAWPLASMMKEREVRVITVGTANAELVVIPQAVRADGMTVQIKYAAIDQTVEVPLVGAFQAENLATTLGLMVASGISLTDILPHIATLPCVPGRMELVPKVAENQPTVLVDYAHTPDALARVLMETKPMVAGKLWVVFGCGGDRDATKRPKMGAAVAQYADVAVVTDDNPRNEDPAPIRAQTIAGMAGHDQVHDVGDRKAAIAYALTEAAPEDVVIIAGKGHESGQTVQGEVHPFDDRLVAQEILEGLA